MDNQPHRTHTGGLYCSEGSTHVSRPTVRIREPPGGDSSWNFLNPTGSSTSVTQQNQSEAASSATSHHSRFSKKETVVTGKIGHSTTVSAPVEQTSTTPPVEEASAAPNNNNDGSLGAIYCVEGSQVRTRPSVKIRGETRRNYNILSFE